MNAKVAYTLHHYYSYSCSYSYSYSYSYCCCSMGTPIELSGIQ